MDNYVKKYVDDIQQLVSNFDKDAIIEIISIFNKTKENSGRIFVCGNGGSAAHAIHFSGDLSKNVTKEENGRFNVISLCENITAITAYANDIGYEVIFSEQLKNQRVNNKDVLFAISSSGNSPNIVKACEYAKAKGAKIIGLSGFSGGKLREISDFSLHISCNEYEKVEDLHMMALHIIVSYFKNNHL